LVTHVSQYTASLDRRQSPTFPIDSYETPSERLLGPQNGIRLDLSELSGETLGQEIWNLYQNPARRQAMASANRMLAMERYDVSVVCAEMATLYRHIVNSASPRKQDNRDR
jgi:glycosyltransferase involved in cell wall biosynthesis